MVREALTALAVAVVVSGTFGVLIYLGANALMAFIFCNPQLASDGQCGWYAVALKSPSRPRASIGDDPLDDEDTGETH
jgi:hypothetical protein